jgi:hypothetical protein
VLRYAVAAVELGKNSNRDLFSPAAFCPYSEVSECALSPTIRSRAATIKVDGIAADFSSSAGAQAVIAKLPVVDVLAGVILSLQSVAGGARG